MRAAAALFALLVLLGAGGPARAERAVVWDEEEPPPVYVPELRDAPRPVVGFDFGLGGFDGLCEDCRFAGGVSLNVFGGAQLTRRVALLAEAWEVLHLLASDGEDSGVVGHGIATLAPRVWVIPTLWLQAGVGGGMLAAVGRRGNVREFGPAATFALGAEMDHAPLRGIDLQLRLGGTRFDDGSENALFYSVAAMVGYHWN